MNTAFPIEVGRFQGQIAPALPPGSSEALVSALQLAAGQCQFSG
jgi:hypothetical protein